MYQGSHRSRVLARLVSLALVAPIAWWPVSAAGASPPQKERRKDLMDQLGLPKKKPPKDEPEESENEGDSGEGDSRPNRDEGRESPGADDGGSSTGGEGSASGGSASGGSGGSKRRTTFRRVHGALESDCGACHGSGKMAAGTRFVITGDLDADYRAAKRLVNTGKPESSLLLTKAVGSGHGGGTTYPEGSSKHRRLLEWIEDGAIKGGGGGSTSAPTPEPKAPSGGEGSGSETRGKGEAGKSGAAKHRKAPRAASEDEGEAPEPTWVQPAGEGEGEAEAEATIAYAPESHQILQARCGSCHAHGGFAAGSFALSGDPARDYERVRTYVEPEEPEASPLLSKARGEAHGGGEVLAVDDADYSQLLAWIEGGAAGPTAAAEAPPEGEGAARAEDEVEVDATTGASVRASEPGVRLGDGTPVPETAGSRLPFSLPYHLRLNGRFDLSYERRDYKDHPFGPGRNKLATYHHFLFLSRSGAEDPFGFNVELITQQFYEFNARFVTKNRRAKFLIKAGKILVPFGDEPLYHSSYGGKTGFDQELLPVIWSQPGIAVNAHIQAGPVTISNDAYAVQGYALREPDGVLNLQGDFSTLDDFHFAVGDRVGLSWAPLTAWYSLQVNPLGHDRLLLMQAVDLEFWRLQDVPFLQDLVVGVGGVRADVSGGGPGEDYYHFGSYGKVRYYPIDWLYIQYRWGLKTFDNRRGLYYDKTRANERDASSHNVSIGATWKGMFAALQMFWNLEKANEQDNDFLRLTVGYAF